MMNFGCHAGMSQVRAQTAPAARLPLLFQTLALLLVTAVFGSGCRAKVSATSNRTSKASKDPTAKGEPVEIPGSLAAERMFFQSRGVITLDVSSTALQLGEQFSLVNNTTKATLIENESSSLELLGDEAMANKGWLLGSGYDVTLRLFLLDPTIRASFAPGENALQLFVDSTGDDKQQTAKTTITLHDFDVQGMTIGCFESGEQRTDDGFQGGFELVARSEVTSGGKAFLSTGFMAITNE